MLSGDLNPALDRVGIAGAGESMLNTAMMVYALHPLVDWARRRNQEPLAAEWSAWERTLREAVSEAYGRNAFVRAYTDTGDPVGDGTDTAFAEAQAWAVIARCGTDTQRAEALDTLVRSSGDTGLPALTVPYGVPPQDVSSWRTAPGDGWNGGFCAVTAAWCVWALAAERRMADALAEWERATIRRRAALNPKTAVPWLTNVAETASHLAGGRAGGSVLGDSAQSGNVPDILSVAWSEFALHMALRE
jgi:cellobiose phosphorylase